MISYDAVRQRPNQFLACTSLTIDEFDILFHSFSHAWEEYRKKTYVNSGGGNPKLPRVVDKFFFILFYYKIYPIQSAMGVIFGMSQSQVCTWIHVLSPVLKCALGIEKCLPARNPRTLKAALEACELYDFIIDGTERERQRPSNPSLQTEYYTGELQAHTYNRHHRQVVGLNGQ